MKRRDFESMSADEMWTLHEEITAELAVKIHAEKKALENRLRLLVGDDVRKPERRPYPIVLPKFRKPAEPSQTWSGRGRQPRWLTAQLRSGKRIDDFRMSRVVATLKQMISSEATGQCALFTSQQSA